MSYQVYTSLLSNPEEYVQIDITEEDQEHLIIYSDIECCKDNIFKLYTDDDEVNVYIHVAVKYIIDNKKLWFDDYCVASEDRLNTFLNLIRCNPDYTVELIGTEGLEFDVDSVKPTARNQMKGIIVRKNGIVEYKNVKEYLPDDCEYINMLTKNKVIKLIHEGGNIGDILDDYKNDNILSDEDPVELDMVYESYLGKTLKSFHKEYDVHGCLYDLKDLVRMDPNRYPYGYYDIATTLLLGCHYGMIGNFIYNDNGPKSVREFYLTSPYVHESTRNNIVTSNKIKQLEDCIYKFKTYKIFKKHVSCLK